MTLIIGGAYQGKTDCAVNLLKIKREEILDGEVISAKQVFSAKAVRHFELLIKRVFHEKNITEFIGEIYARNPDITIICTEIGGGIIPLDKAEREWREETGRACCYLAENAEKVIRVCCGIPNFIKGKGAPSGNAHC